jgi:membrane protein DedA with SNARE-associated domain/rhodanese-related sulfurtransferase
MNETLAFLVRNGAIVVFAAVFAEQIGVPLPAAPWLLAAGALVAAGKMNLFIVLGGAIFASLVADMTWFYLGRHYGQQILSLLCRISLERDSCVRRTNNLFTRYGMRGIVAAKFIPGFSTVVPPLAGSSGISVFRFMLCDALGAFLHEGCFIFVGALFSHQLVEIINAMAGLGRGALMVVLGLAVFYIGYKYFQRHKLIGELRIARITVDELYKKQQARERLIVLDLRSITEIGKNPSVIRGALQMNMDQVRLREKEFPRDCEIVLYCSCPNEVSSARVALQLQRKGLSHVRPLLGGIDAWRQRNFPMDQKPIETDAKTMPSASQEVVETGTLFP